MPYVDGFVLAVPEKNRAEYEKIAREMSRVFKKYGATKAVECWGDDVPDGKLTSFPMAVKKKDDEVVVFSWIVWPSKAARDEGNAKMMEDPVFKDMDMSKMPFDGKRMIFGGFEVMIDG